MSFLSFLFRPAAKRFERSIEAEIYDKIFVQLRDGDHLGYPFNTLEELKEASVIAETQSRFKALEQIILKMPKSYGPAFRYIMYRDLNERLQMYERLAVRRTRYEPDTAVVLR